MCISYNIAIFIIVIANINDFVLLYGFADDNSAFLVVGIVNFPTLICLFLNLKIVFIISVYRGSFAAVSPGLIAFIVICIVSFHIGVGDV